ncbi:MAG: adenine deaminase [Candidatus Gracilibacteria bacterium]
MPSLSGNIVDVLKKKIFPGTLKIKGSRIVEILYEPKKRYKNYILPGLIDSHIHLESSMLPPAEFARIAATHGTVATVSDPHEIANVLGLRGMRFMLNNAKKVPFHFYFGAPSCVPASPFETNGATLGPKEIEHLFKLKSIRYLAEVMNMPGVIHRDPEIMRKIQLAHRYKKQIDGHAPGLTGENLKKYINAGITTDHECFTREEALEEFGLNVYVQIREGSAAKNFDELVTLLKTHADHCMLCSDDKHPNDLVEGHINLLIKRALKKNIPLFNVLTAACVNPVKHYKLDVGLLQKNDSADFIIVDNLKHFNVLKTYIRGNLVAQNGKSLIKRSPLKPLNNFKAKPKAEKDLQIPIPKNFIKNHELKIRVIDVIDHQLITRKKLEKPLIKNGKVVSDPGRDLLKIAVINRYQNKPVALGFIHNFGFKKGAIASSVAHDSHNVIAVGADDKSLLKAINIILKNHGGICAVSPRKTLILPLKIAGLMSLDPYAKVARRYIEIDRMAKTLGSHLHAPFMTLAFMGLLVIPDLKISDQGLFDGKKFQFTSLFKTQ